MSYTQARTLLAAIVAELESGLISLTEATRKADAVVSAYGGAA